MIKENIFDELEPFPVYPIGYIHRGINDMYLEILPAFRPALRELDNFSHIIVLYWADQNGSLAQREAVQMQVEPPYAPGKVTGIFATRSELRPNPILLTPCKIDAIDQQNGIIHIQMIDGFDGSPILDIKGYFPIMDRVNGAVIPSWLDWGLDHVPDEGLGLYEDMDE